MTKILIISILIIVIVVVKLIVPFLKDVKSSKKDFQGKPMKEVFSALIENFNNGVFGGNVRIIENNLLNITLIHNVSSQHKVVLQYVKGALVINWYWKYFHQELNHKIIINDVLNVSEDKMLEIETKLGTDMAAKMEKHAANINKNMS